MPSLQTRVTQQRNAVMARGPGIRMFTERLHTRLRHPVVLIPAFLGGMLSARVAPGLSALPRLTTRLRKTTHEMRELHATLTLIATLLPLLLRPWGALPGDDASGARSRPRQQDPAHCPPST
jgi:hypothetical protein